MPGDRLLYEWTCRSLGITLVVLLLASVTPCAAGPLLDAALQKAPRSPCEAAATEGETAANEERWPAVWFSTSAVNAVYVLPVVPLLSHIDREPPEEALTFVPPQALECFTHGYKKRAEQRRVRAAWTGWGIMLASLLVYMAVVPDVGWDP